MKIIKKAKVSGKFPLSLNFKIFIFANFFIVLFLTIYPSILAESLQSEKNILGKSFYLLAEKELIYGDHSFRQFWEACLVSLINCGFILKATAYLDDEHIILASAKTGINRFRFMSQENRGTQVPDPGWLGNDHLYFQIHILEEAYGLVVSFKLGTDQRSGRNQTFIFRAERSLHEFLTSLDEILKGIKKPGI